MARLEPASSHRGFGLGLRFRCAVRVAIRRIPSGVNGVPLSFWHMSGDFTAAENRDGQCSDVIAGRPIEVEEWLDHKSTTEHKRRNVVFDSVSGQEIAGPLVDALNSASDWKRIRTAVESTPDLDTIVA